MKIVKVKDIGVQVNGISYFKNSIFEVNDEDYEPIKDFVDVLKENKTLKQKESNERIIIIEVKDKELDLKEVEQYLYNCLERFEKTPIGENPNPEGEQEISNNNGSDTNVGGIDEENPEGNDGEDEELNALKETAKKLGINVTHNMRKETIIKRIEEVEKAKEEQSQNPEGE